ncbi:MAG: hypothetical protein JWL85_415 [Candidatus Saccharibacteria bacterium]|nr:hypothetical protein [Candidatus Saccharibacteria bacterium]
MKNPKRMPSKKVLLIALLVVILLAGAFIFMQSRRNSTASTSVDQPVEKIDLSPPTDAEKQEADARKEIIVKEQESQNQSQPTPGAKKAVKPIMTTAGFYDNQVEVSAFVPEVYEQGTCTLTLTKGTAKVTKQTAGVKDATTTRCENFVIPRKDIPSAGIWSAVVAYTSATANGSSEAKNVEVK